MINNFLEEDQYHSSNLVYSDPVTHNGIHIGDIQAALDIELIKRLGIRTIVTASAGMEHVSYDSSFRHVVFPLLDLKSQDIAQFFNDFYHLAEAQIQQGNILVHCAAGISRSCTLVTAYLMKKNQWTFRQAIAFIRKSRPSALPNLGFERQLKAYEHQLTQSQPPLERRAASKTSEERKNTPGTINRLPEIGSMRRTQLRPKLVDLFVPEETPAKVKVKQKQQFQFYGTRKIAFKPLKSRSVTQKQSYLSNGSCLPEATLIKLKQSLPTDRTNSVLRRLNLGRSNAATERQLRMKPLDRWPFS